MKPGDTFLIPDAIGTHLNCVLAVLGDGSVVVCHFTTCHRRSDRTCVIKAGEHSFCTKPETCVRYDQAQILSEEGLQALERLITKRLELLSVELLGARKERRFGLAADAGQGEGLAREVKSRRKRHME